LRFGLRIVLPTLLAIGLFVIAIFALILPAYERQILDRKREMIRELTHSAVSILAEYESEERAGTLTREQAQRGAITRLRYLRYGEDGKDYFWVTDRHPRMIMHPYRPDLEGADLSAFADPAGKLLFVEMVETVRARGDGFVEYVWQWKDDPARIVPKLSHIRAFPAWGWVVGTGIYLEDVRHEISRLTGHLVRLSLGIVGLLTLLLLLILQQSLSIERRRSRAEASLVESREKYRALVDASTEGIALVLDGRITFANPVLLGMLERTDQEVEGLRPDEILEDSVGPTRPPGGEGAHPLGRDLFPPGGEGPIPSLRDLIPGSREARLRRQGGKHTDVVVTTSRIQLGPREALILSFREVSPRERAQRGREELAVELQVWLQFLQEPVRRFMQEPVHCTFDEPIQRAAERMRRCEVSAILVGPPRGEPVGIITDRDVRDRVVAEGLDPAEPVRRIMSAPLQSFPESGLAGEALLRMFERRVRHLVIHDATGRVVGLLRDRELTAAHRFSPATLVREINQARSADEIVDLRERVPRLVAALIDTGSPPRSINRIMAAVSDATHQTLVALAVKELGPPPVPFAFITLGSDGREEQTLATDQDNAIIHADPPEDLRSVVEPYFRALGERVCLDLDRAGYALCPGEIMASNPRWRLSLSAWVALYTHWMEAPEPRDLLEFSVFFDFRSVVGDAGLVRSLREAIATVLRRNPPFLLHLARHALEFRLPMGSFGRIVTESTGAHDKSFNIKEAMAPVVHVARLYALRHGVEATNTLERLHLLHEQGVLRSPSHEEVVQVYEYLMRLRLAHQAEAMREGRVPDNHLPTEGLTDLDRAMLKQASARISLLIKKVSYDFLGSA
jgi:signal-transduction protein with cAMP-binding, CBS, and nucleotidyltransferase domain